MSVLWVLAGILVAVAHGAPAASGDVSAPTPARERDGPVAAGLHAWHPAPSARSHAASLLEVDSTSPEAAEAGGGAPASPAAEAAAEAIKARPRRGVGLYGANVPNELQVFAQAGLKWFYTWT